jgi:hypothetical protein
MNKSCVSLFAVFLLLVGCSNEPGHSLAEAQKITEPWQAYTYLNDNEDAILDCKQRFLHYACSRDESAFESAKYRYLESAATAMHPDALLTVFENNSLKKEQMSLAPKVLAAAETASGNATDRKLLYLAGRILAKGEFVVRDVGLASDYFARAWAAGLIPAARDASILYKSVNDVTNAYLWSLRCINRCNRDYEIQLGYFEQKLSPKAAKQAQTAASDPTIVELDTGK